MDKADNFERAAVLNYRSAERLADKVEDLIAEFGADAMPMIGEWIGEWRHARRQMERPVVHDVGRCSDCPPTGYPTDKTRCVACDRAPTD